MSVGFFDRPQTQAFVEDFSQSRKVTVFAGAGVSIDRGSPGWDDLIHMLLAERIVNSNLLSPTLDSGWEAEDVARSVVHRLGLLGSASLVRQLFAEAYPKSSDAHLRNRLYDLLYDDWIQRDSLANAIGKFCLLKKSFGCDIHVVTPNYDTNIEASIEDYPPLQELARENDLHFQPYGICPPNRPSPNVIPVVHIHGCITSSGDTLGQLVFCEDDYGQWSDPTPGSTQGWYSVDLLRAYLHKRFKQSDTLFIATSMRDPNVIDALVHTNRERIPNRRTRRFAAMPIADDWPEYSMYDRDTRRELFLHAERRLTQVGIDSTLRPDHYGQLSQLFHELSLCASNPGEYHGESKYGDRIRRWWSEWSRSVNERDGGAIGAHELTVREVHQVRLASCLEDLAELGLIADPNHVKLELWLRCNPDDRRLVLWSSSEVVHSSARPSHTAQIDHGSGYQSVRALASRRTEAGSFDEHRSPRWGEYIACPVVLSDHPWLELPVGVISLLFSRDDQLRLSDKQVQTISEFIATVGQELASS